MARRVPASKRPGAVALVTKQASARALRSLPGSTRISTPASRPLSGGAVGRRTPTGAVEIEHVRDAAEGDVALLLVDIAEAVPAAT
jgi:hypothetical protein